MFTALNAVVLVVVAVVLVAVVVFDMFVPGADLLLVCIRKNYKVVAVSLLHGAGSVALFRLIFCSVLKKTVSL